MKSVLAGAVCKGGSRFPCMKEYFSKPAFSSANRERQTVESCVRSGSSDAKLRRGAYNGVEAGFPEGCPGSARPMAAHCDTGRNDPDEIQLL